MTQTVASSSISSQVASPSLPALYCALTKIRLSALVVATAAVGFVLASPAGIDWPVLAWTVLGTALAAASAAALNQVAERSLDARMRRTAGRPIPAGHMSAVHAFVVGVLLCWVGIAILAVAVSLAAAGIALATILLYVLVYTPMKTRTSFNTLVGAVVGALPPVLGWVAATSGRIDGAWILGGLLVCWQLPHFLALAWMYREDYERGGFRMLPSIDPGGELTSRVCVLTSLALLPLSLSCSLAGLTGIAFAVIGTGLGCWMVLASLRFWRRREQDTARQLFLTSITYLPLLLVAMVLDRTTIEWIDISSAVLP